MQEVRQNSVVKAHYLWGADGRKLNVFDATLRNSYDYMGSLVLAQTNGIWSGEAYFAEGVIRDGHPLDGDKLLDKQNRHIREKTVIND